MLKRIVNGEARAGEEAALARGDADAAGDLALVVDRVALGHVEEHDVAGLGEVG